MSCVLPEASLKQGKDRSASSAGFRSGGFKMVNHCKLCDKTLESDVHLQ